MIYCFLTLLISQFFQDIDNPDLVNHIQRIGIEFFSRTDLEKSDVYLPRNNGIPQ